MIVADLARGRVWTPLQSSVMMAPEPRLCIVGGRRLGKSYVGAAKFLARVFSRMAAMGRDVRAGRRQPWAGISLPRKLAKELDPDVEAWVVAPRALHLNRCRANILSYLSGPYSRLIHPEIGLTDSGRQLWLLAGGVSCRIRFAVAGSVSSMVSTGVHELWIEEAGLTEGAVISALDPVTWEHGSHRICTGTPALGTEHWYTRAILSGLDPDHPFYVPDVVERDPNARTITGSSYDSPVAEVREAAAAAEKTAGKAWSALWVHGDWRVQDVYIYGEYDPDIHVVDYDPKTFNLSGHRLRRPDLVLGVKDWAYSDTRPGAVVVLHVWHRNPLNPEDRTRPLIIAVADDCSVRPYTDAPGGWYQLMAELRRRHGVRYWIADPSRHKLIEAAAKHIAKVGKVKPASKEDKSGRIVLVQSLIHHEAGVDPALYISRECQALQAQIPAYRRKFSRTGEVQEEPYDYNDHALDCLAFATGHLMVGGESTAPPAIR